MIFLWVITLGDDELMLIQTW